MNAEAVGDKRQMIGIYENMKNMKLLRIAKMSRDLGHLLFI